MQKFTKLNNLLQIFPCVLRDTHFYKEWQPGKRNICFGVFLPTPSKAKAICNFVCEAPEEETYN